MPPLLRGTCPGCGGDVALRRDGSTREHADRRHELYGVGQGVVVPKCPGSAKLAVEQAARLGIRP